MRKTTIIALTLICIIFTGCENSGKPEIRQPEININYGENDDTDSLEMSENPDDMQISGNSGYSEDKHNAASVSSNNSEYDLAIFGSDDVSTISGKEYDSGEVNMHGTVLGIGKLTVTINRAFTAEYTPDGKYIDANTMVSLEEPDEQVIEYVQFMEESTFTLRETKNNGSAKKDSPASFEDIKTGVLLDLRGYYIDGLFNAVNTIIYRNVD